MAVNPEIGLNTLPSTGLTSNLTLPNALAPSSSSPTGTTGTTPPVTQASTIRNISQTTQEREIVKTAPDIVVYFEGLPYLQNYFIGDPDTKNSSTLVNFNDHVTAFSASYDTDLMVPNATIGLQVPNYQKYLYQMPGGNNLIGTMMQVQVYAKAYYMSSNGDTVYRRVFKGITSHIGYNDNGKTLEISVQCQGTMHLLEKMQINIHPSALIAHELGSAITPWETNFASHDCFSILAYIFKAALKSDGFQFASLKQAALKPGDPFFDAVTRGYMAKWQVILNNMVKDVHIYGPNKDTLGQDVVLKRDQNFGTAAKNKAHAGQSVRPVQKESVQVSLNSPYYAKIQQYLPFRNITSIDLTQSVIVNRLDIIREVVKKMDFEAYQDVDGKIIVKPPLYNLDVTTIGSRSAQTSSAPNSPQATSSLNTTTGPSSLTYNQQANNPPTTSNSLTNQLTQITGTNNPFVVYLSEILTEQETEDQSAIRRTRTTVTGNIMPSLPNIGFKPEYSPVAEYIDVVKMAKFGNREEPLYQVPWITLGDLPTLFAHAAAETARANRGYRTYTITIPMRPELKLGFPVFFPHKDFYAYIKSISINYQVGGTATMSVVCDSVRSRVLVNTPQTVKTGGGALSSLSYQAYTPAPNLVLQWTNNPLPATQPDPAQSPSYNQSIFQPSVQSLASGDNRLSFNVPQNLTNPVGISQTMLAPATNADGSKFGPTDDQKKIFAFKTNVMANAKGNQASTPSATYVIKNDGVAAQGTINPKTGTGYFNSGTFRPADGSYVADLCGNPTTRKGSVIPYTDDKGYELISPFPWGRWQSLNVALYEFTEQGWIQTPTDVNGNPTNDLQDEAVLLNTEAFLFAGLGTPSATGDASSTLQTALATQSGMIGGPYSGSAPAAMSSSATNKGTNSQNVTQPDVTVIVLRYNQPGQVSDNTLLNASQPENALAASLVTTSSSQVAAQQLIDVLVTGAVAPIKAVQEQLEAAQNAQLPTTKNLALTVIGGSTTVKVTQAVNVGPPPEPTSSTLPDEIT